METSPNFLDLFMAIRVHRGNGYGCGRLERQRTRKHARVRTRHIFNVPGIDRHRHCLCSLSFPLLSGRILWHFSRSHHGKLTSLSDVPQERDPVFHPGIWLYSVEHYSLNNLGPHYRTYLSGTSFGHDSLSNSHSLSD